VEFIQAIAANWHIIANVGSGLVALGVLWLSANYVSNKIFAHYKREVATVNDKQDQRLAVVEAAYAALGQQLANLPTAEDIHELKLTLTRMGGHFEAMQAQINGQQEILKIVKAQGDRTQAFLLEHGAKK
jgi:hypothetical protein